ncbi:MAG: hypothetical protein ACYC6Y_23105, partial [Thermoguttaceae bacterium]
MQQRSFDPLRFGRVVFGAWLPALAAWLAASGGTAAELPPLEGRHNLAIGRPVLFSPAPDYNLTAKGGSDANDLTDGKVTARQDRRLWFDSAGVGWSYGGRVNLAVDLGKSARIDEVAVRLLGGGAQAGVSIPGWIEVFVSQDGRYYTKVAEFSR